MLSLIAIVVLALSGQSQTARPGAQTDAMFALQVALDRAGFSCGAIDGRAGKNTDRALEAFRKQRGQDPEPVAEPTTRYHIAEDDVAGPFQQTIPADLVEQSKLPALAYTSAAEALAERFHTTSEVLRKLNPTAKFTAGETILVPNVEPFVLPTDADQAAARAEAKAIMEASKPKPTGTAGRTSASQQPQTTASVVQKEPVVVTVSKSSSSLTVARPDGSIVLFAPVTTGSEHDPLPTGQWKVNAVQFNPAFRYNPDLFWDADPSHSKALIKPGPNNPVGVVWIDLSKEHYGLHGSPEPSKIGHTQSHGCVRLTNWDATRLAKLVAPGTQVIFTE
jgi:lipoprotein-anchoring transpeptidase ErfK/SrfK